MQKIPVAAVNPSLFKPDSLEQILYFGADFSEHYSIITLTGNDRVSFLHQQCTSNIKDLPQGAALLSCLLGLRGELLSYFYVGKKEDSLVLFVQPALLEQTIERLEKYLVVEDVEILIEKEAQVGISFGRNSFDLDFQTVLYGQKAWMGLSSKSQEVLRESSGANLLRLGNGEPLWGQEISDPELVNNTRLFDLGVDLNKGCFLGQESVAKIAHHRGAAYAPMLLEHNEGKLALSDFMAEGRKGGKVIANFSYESKNYSWVQLFRDFRLEEKKIIISLEGKKFEAKVKSFPLFPDSNKQKAQELFTLGVDLFQNNKDEKSLAYFQRALELDPSNEEICESLGVLLGRLGQYDQAIHLMKKLIEINPDSVMAYSNLSMFYMKQGKIEEAEEAQAEATVKSFEKLARESKDKKELARREEQEQAQILSRQKMFEQVLEIDPEDAMALNGLGEIYLKWDELSKAQALLEKLICIHTDYSQGYLNLGSLWEKLGNIEKAKEAYEKGIQVAMNKGELMPAQKMQKAFSKLISD